MPVALIIVLVAIASALTALFWYGLRGEPNEPPALGSNFPAAYFPNSPIVSDDEQFRDEADARLAAETRRRDHERRLSSD